jgi:hypothetical protein
MIGPATGPVFTIVRNLSGPRKDSTYKSRGGKYADPISPLKRSPDISHGSSHDSQWRRSSEASEEATEHDSFNILSNGDWYLEDCEDEVSGKEWNTSTEDL